MARLWNFQIRQDRSAGSWQRSLVSQYQNKEPVMQTTTLKKYRPAIVCLLFCMTLMSASRPLPARLALPGSENDLPDLEIFTTPKVLIFSKTNGYRHAAI